MDQLPDNSTDKFVFETLVLRDKHLQENMYEYGYLISNEKYFMDYFMNLSNEEIETCITYLPKGSIIFHGATCKTYVDNKNPSNTLPPVYPLIQTEGNPITAIKRILNFESRRKAIGSILALYPDDEQKAQEEAKKYNDHFFQSNNEGIFVGKHYMWCNTTMDANIMVDIRLMDSMTVFITNKDLYLLDFMKLTQKIITDATDFDSITLLFYKRWLNLTSEVTRDEENTTGKKYLNLEYIINEQEINLKLRNKFLNSIGEAVYLNILNYILALKGLLFKIDGYADYDLADMTPNIYDPNSKTISSSIEMSTGVKYICKEIMLNDAPQYLSYLGGHTIQKPDTEPVTTEMLLDIKKEVMDTLFSSLNKLVLDNGASVKLEWCDTVDKLTYDSPSYYDNYQVYHKNMKLMPHYRYKINESTSVVSLYKLIDMISTNTDKFTVNNLGYPLNSYEIGDGTQSGGSPSIDKLYENIKNMSARTTDDIISSDVYESVINYANIQNANDLTVQDISAQKLAEKAAVNGVVTKVFHTEFFKQDLPTKFIMELYKVLSKPEILESMINYLNDNDGKTVLSLIMDEAKVQNIKDLQLGDFFVFYVKGSTSLYMNIIDIGSQVMETCKVDQMFSKTSLGGSDIDFNLCINPIIMNQDKLNNTTNFEDIVNYLSEISNLALQTVKYQMQYTFLTATLLESYMSKCNLEFNKLYGKNEIDNLLDVNYVYPIFELDFTLQSNGVKEYHQSMLTPFKLVTNKQISKVINYSDFILLRLAISARTNKYLPCICEIFDISVITHNVESQFIWSHRKNVIKAQDIIYNNLLNELFDMNATLLNSIQFGITKKLDKRLHRYKLIEKLINCDSVNEDYRGVSNNIKRIDAQFNNKLWVTLSLLKNEAITETNRDRIVASTETILNAKPELENFIVDILTEAQALYFHLLKYYDQKELLLKLKFDSIYQEIANLYDKIQEWVQDDLKTIQGITSFKYYEYNKNLGSQVNNSNNFIIYHWLYNEVKYSENFLNAYNYIDTIEQGHNKIISQVIEEQNYIKTVNKPIDPVTQLQIKPTTLNYEYNNPTKAIEHVAILNNLFIEQVNEIIPVSGNFINKEIDPMNNTGEVEYLIATKDINLMKIKISTKNSNKMRGGKDVVVKRSNKIQSAFKPIATKQINTGIEFKYAIRDPVINLYEKYSDRSNQISDLINKIISLPFIKYKKIKVKEYDFKISRELNDVDLREASLILFTPSFNKTNHLE